MKKKAFVSKVDRSIVEVYKEVLELSSEMYELTGVSVQGIPVGTTDTDPQVRLNYLKTLLAFRAKLKEEINTFQDVDVDPELVAELEELLGS